MSYHSDVYCEANGAHLASSSDLDILRVNETHVIIHNVLYEDLCNSMRGVSFLAPSVYNSSSINNIS